jgi:hypothetical protein
MSAGALVDALASAGVRLSLADDGLHYQTRPGVSIAPYREQITEHKPALLAELRLREEIVAAAPAVHACFDRQRYDELWRRWGELQEGASA